jgi:hypothetical protein
MEIHTVVWAFLCTCRVEVTSHRRASQKNRLYQHIGGPPAREEETQRMRGSSAAPHPALSCNPALGVHSALAMSRNTALGVQFTTLLSFSQAIIASHCVFGDEPKGRHCIQRPPLSDIVFSNNRKSPLLSPFFWRISEPALHSFQRVLLSNSLQIF